MTHHDPRRSYPQFLTVLSIGLAVGGLLLTAGCKKEEEKTVERPRVVDEGPKEPEWKPIYASMDLSPKINVEMASYENCNSEQIRAAFAFMDAFAKGDSEALRGMLSPEMLPVLDELRQSGEWGEATEQINSVELMTCVGETEDSFLVNFIINDPSSSEVIDQKWKGRARGDIILFTADYTIEKLPFEQALEVLEGIEGESDEPVGKGRGNDDENPRDPRKRVPRERETPEDPGGPGQ